MRKEVRLVKVNPNELLYVVSRQPIMEGDVYLTPDLKIMYCVGKESSEQLEGCNKVMAFPEQIPTDEISLKKITEILNNGGEFDIEMEDEFTNPKAFEDVEWGDGLPRIALVNNKIVI
jgi:hypothetical protein